jgi:Circadian oscillating protein COP23
MKLGVLVQILSLIGLTFGATVGISQSSNAQTGKFYCGMSRGVPATLVRTPRGNKPMIRWVDSAFPPPWTPEKRCEEISARFQRFFDNGTLNFLRAGRSNGQSVLCVASYKGGSCLPNGVLVTLKADKNPRDIMQQLLDNRAGSSGDGTIQLSGSRNNPAVSTDKEAAYVDVKQLIGESCPAGKPVWECQ